MSNYAFSLQYLFCRAQRGKSLHTWRGARTLAVTTTLRKWSMDRLFSTAALHLCPGRSDSPKPPRATRVTFAFGGILKTRTQSVYITLSRTQSVRVSVSRFLCPGFWILRSTECGTPRAAARHVFTTKPREKLLILYSFCFLFLDCGARPKTRPKRPIRIESEQSGEKARVAQSKK